MNPVVYLAPIQGITEYPYRKVFPAHFKGLNLAVSPFIATSHSKKITGQLAKEFSPENNPTLPLVPQILGKIRTCFSRWPIR